jgi:DNA-binding response OmpR family regulator
MMSSDESRKVLIVDDSELTLAAAAIALERGGFQVKTATTMGTAETILAGWSPDLVVTDVHMPGLDGTEVCAWMKSRMARAVPVLLYSGLPEEELEPLALKAGADGFVSKGRGLRHLVAGLRALFAEGRGDAS